MGNEEKRTPDARPGSDDATPERANDGQEEATGGKLIRADVFLSRLAERQEERDFAGGEAKVVDAILGALESLGIDPNIVAPEFVRMARATSPSDDETSEAEPPSLEDMAVEERFLRELHAGQQPSLGAYTRRHSAQRDALLRLATRMDPAELAGFDAEEAITPDQEEAARAGQEEGTRRALREVAKRGAARGRGARRVAEERAPYTATPADEADVETPAQRRKRARPAQAEESEPER